MSHNFTPLIINLIGGPSGPPALALAPQDDGVEALIGREEGWGRLAAGQGGLMGPGGVEAN